MKKNILCIVFFLSAALLTGSCVREQLNPLPGESEGMVDCTIAFGSPKGAEITVGTKAQLGLARESNVFNIYLLIFDSAGKKVYGHYFDGTNLGADSESNYWTVTNMSSDSDPATNGTLHIRTSKKSACTLVAVANMNPNDLDVSAGLLSSIQSINELEDLVATQVRSEIAANSGFFLMTGEAANVSIQGDTSDPDDISHKSLLLRRLYSKVTVNVRIKKGAPIRDFIPYSWQIVNVPSCSYLLERTTPYDDAADTEAEFFSTEELNFESERLTTEANDFYADGVTKVSIHSFSFYMMENRKAPSSGITTYADRERRVKPAPYSGGHFTNGDYVYTNPLATFFTFSGKIVMGVDSGVNPDATLDANVKYEVHLGNFGTDVADFNVLRNYNYIYNIYINGADDIKAEVEAYDGLDPLQENEPGATGEVVVALEEVFNSDCHYSTHVLSFHADYIQDPSKISWYVETPFNPSGVGGKDVDAGTVQITDIDYKWVEFLVNPMDESGVYYSDKRAHYRPHNYDFRDIDGNIIPPGDKRRTMYVDELVAYLKGQKTQYDADQKKLDPGSPEYDPDYSPHSDFDSDSGEGGPKITVTAFVSEYYYTENPLTGVYDPTLWKRIVNSPMRRMHILASTATSADGESTLIGSSFTLQQRSIQSIYAIQESADLTSAWGMEFTDDEMETGLADYWRNKDFEDNGNTSTTNGRLNSLKLWGILNPDGTENAIGERWDKFLNLDGDNETAPLLDDYNYLRYSCLSRNRDNDGNETIDADEIRWYMATDIQLIGVFLGSYGIEGDARLYQRSAGDQAASDKNKWRQHIIASNRYLYPEGNPADWNNSNKYPRIVWAEEGVNGSNMNYSGNDQTTKFSTRCVRNLGYYVEGGQRKDITKAESPDAEPDPYATVVRKHLNEDGSITSPYTGAYDNRTFFTFDCSRINTASLREPVDHELIGHDESSKMACLSAGFETAPAINLVSLDGKGSYIFNGKTYNLKQYESLNQYLDDSFPDLDANFKVCPAGYRLPNVREMSLMWTMLAPTGDSAYLGSANNDTDTTPARTHWSMGGNGTFVKESGKWGWGMSGMHLLMASKTQSISKIRCVRDL